VTSDAPSPASVRRSQGGLAENQVPRPSSFVGRARELHQLQAAFEAAAVGQGALIMLAGEPGIGKTALCEQLCSFVEASAGTPLVGHCYEEGSFRPPYQPFVEVIETYLQERDTDTLTADLGSTAADLARMLPNLHERLRVTPAPPGNPEEDRWRLLQTATDVLRSAAAQRPLLLVLDDLHEADRGTLDLLLYLARNLHGARILVVGTYRDVEVDRAHPLSGALSELHRASNITRMQLRGLSTDEVLRLLAETSHQTIPQPFAELVHRRTEGNPLFVHEMLRYLIDAGLVERRDGALLRVGDETLAGRIPEGLRDAVGKRLSRLSDRTNRLLSVASVIGREFQLDVLRQVLVIEDEELEAALEEASAAAMIEERSVVGTSITYRFSHAFFRETLYEEIVAPRRIRLHQQVARALEEVFSNARRLEEHAAELAEHYAFSSDPVDLGKAIHYGELAARRATDVFAYAEAARLLERTLVLLDLADPENTSKRCDLLLALGQALWPAGDTDRVIADVAPDALALADKLDDRRRAFRGCRLALDCLQAQGASSLLLRPEGLRWAELANRYASHDSTDRVYADIALANAWSRSPDPRRRQEASVLQSHGLALARQLDDAEALFRSAFSLLLTSRPHQWGEHVGLAREATGWPRQGVSAQTLGLVLEFAGGFRLAAGERARAEELWREVDELAKRTRVASVKLMVSRLDVMLSIVDGHLEDALVQLRRYGERADELGLSFRGRMISLQMFFSLARYLGRADAWLTASDEFARMGGFPDESTAAPRAATCLADLARLDEARALVGPMLDEIAAGSGGDETLFGLVNFLEAAVAVGHRHAAAALMARLDCVAHVSIGPAFQTSVGRHLGDAAVLVGDRAAARVYYAQALEAAGKIRFRPELALTHLRLAELLLHDRDQSEGLAHLGIAIPELRDMKMQPPLERALALSDTYQAPPVQMSAPSPTSDGLTAREREIAGLIAGGLSNREISGRLVITEGTVEVHVKHILSKLDFRSRSQVAAWMSRQHSETPAPCITQ
jgi:DNA-binding CsgD family transcriptional regulator/tetratricopeptide (TPR) repeat protein